MEKLKSYIEIARTVSNKDISRLEKQIFSLKDKIDENFLKDTTKLEEILRNKQSKMNWQFGYIAALDNISNFIEELEKEDDLEFEKAIGLIGVEAVTEKSLRADA